MLPELPDAPTVSVIIPARDAAATLPATVAAAAQGEVDELVIAVGPSRDGTAAVAAELADAEPRVRVVDSPSGRTPASLNAAVAASRGQVLVRVDAHALLPPGYVARAVERLRASGAGVVGGRQDPVAETGFAAAVADAMRSRAGSGGATYRVGGEPGPVDTVYLGVFRREALAAVGGFDERFVRNQDAECNLRLREAGFQVWFDPELAVAYTPRATPRALWDQYRGYGRWRRATARTHPGSLAPRQLAAPVLVAVLAAAGADSLVRRSWTGPLAAGGYAAGLLAAGTAAAARPRRGPQVALALAIMHLAWGVGFWQGPPRGWQSLPAADDGGPTAPAGGDLPAREDGEVPAPEDGEPPAAEGGDGR